MNGTKRDNAAEVRRLVRSLQDPGLHLHMREQRILSGRKVHYSYVWSTVTGSRKLGLNQDGSLRGKGASICGTLRCFRLKLKNMVPDE